MCTDNPPLFSPLHDAGERREAKTTKNATFYMNRPKKLKPGWLCDNPFGSRNRDTQIFIPQCFSPFLCTRNHYKRSKHYKIQSRHKLGTRVYLGKPFLSPTLYPYNKIHQIYRGNNFIVYYIYTYAGELVLVSLFCLFKSQEQYHISKTNHSYSSQKQIKS